MVQSTSKPQNGQPSRADLRRQMVAEQIAARGINNPLVLAAMEKSERHLFVPESHRELAYRDSPLPIGYEQTISQPYIVAYMSELLEISGGERLLEIGMGSGYQAAVLHNMGAEVYTIEIVEPLCQRTQQLLEQHGYEKIHTRCDDGYLGWPEKAPFERILLTAAPDYLPEPLLEQLADGGMLVAPVGNIATGQQIIRIRRVGELFEKEPLIRVRFVPLTRKEKS